MNPNIKLRWGASLLLVACGVNSAERHYLLGEKLWTEQKYVAAVSEFEKARKKDPQGPIGLKAHYRAATTQAIFLQEHVEAVQKLREFLKEAKEPETVFGARELIGEVLFSKLRQYDQALEYYDALFREFGDQQPEEKRAEWLFRSAKSAAEVWKFDQAKLKFEELRTKYPKQAQAKRALFELGQIYFTAGEQRAETLGIDVARTDGKDVYRKAIKYYQDYIKQYPDGDRREEAKFGIASCLEELDQLEEAIARYQALMETYPAPSVIQIKIARMTERINQRSLSTKKPTNAGKRRRE